MHYKTLFIDLDDTLWDTRQNMKEALNELYDTHRMDESFDSFDQFYAIYFENNKKLWDLYHHGKMLKPDLIVERFQFPFREVGITLSEDSARGLNDEFIRNTGVKTRLIPHTKELLEHLAPKYSLHILSNGFREAQFDKLRNSGIEHYFERVLLSDDIGYNKPHPKIFAYALSATNTKKEEALMIGDNFDTDITGAHNFKMNQIFFRNNELVEMKFQPTHTVDSLQEIMAIL